MINFYQDSYKNAPNNRQKLVRAYNAIANGNINEEDIINDMIKDLIGYNLLELEVMRRYAELFLRESDRYEEADKIGGPIELK